jgi:hypothetical protein
VAGPADGIGQHHGAVLRLEDTAQSKEEGTSTGKEENNKNNNKNKNKNNNNNNNNYDEDDNDKGNMKHLNGKSKKKHQPLRTACCGSSCRRQSPGT